MVNHKLGKWQQVAADLRAAPDLKKVVAKGVGPHVPAALRAEGLMVETTIVKPRAERGGLYDLYDVTAWFPSPSSTIGLLQAQIPDLQNELISYERDRQAADKEVKDLGRLRNRALHRLRVADAHITAIQAKLDTAQLTINAHTTEEEETNAEESGTTD